MKSDEENCCRKCWAKENRHRKLILESFIFCGLPPHLQHIIQTFGFIKWHIMSNSGIGHPWIVQVLLENSAKIYAYLKPNGKINVTNTYTLYIYIYLPTIYENWTNLSLDPSTHTLHKREPEHTKNSGNITEKEIMDREAVTGPFSVWQTMSL